MACLKPMEVPPNLVTQASKKSIPEPGLFLLLREHGRHFIYSISHLNWGTLATPHGIIS